MDPLIYKSVLEVGDAGSVSDSIYPKKTENYNLKAPANVDLRKKKINILPKFAPFSCSFSYSGEVSHQ